MCNYLRVKDWENFQHYKDRNPPWIKLHRELLHDYDFICLQDASKLQLMLIWLLASQMENKIPADEDFIKRQIGIKGELCLNELIDKGFLVDASNVLATCKQSAMPETEAETETDNNKGKISSKKITLDDWEKKHGKFTYQNVKQWCEEKGYTQNESLTFVDDFRNGCLANGYKYANFEAAFKKWKWEAKGEKRRKVKCI